MSSTPRNPSLDWIIGKTGQSNPTKRSHATAATPLPNRESNGEPSEPLPPSAYTPTTPRPRLDALRSSEPRTFSSFLTDTYDRQHDYLRISITEKCNLRCSYCMPEEGVALTPKKHMLTPQEMYLLADTFVSQGVSKIRYTGGEPTVHPEVLKILRDTGSLQSKGLKELCITTNGLSLHRKLDHMVESGLTNINLSLDTLDPFQFEIMTRRRGFQQVMKSIDRILEMKRLGANLKLKVNAVVIRSLNAAQIMPFVEFTKERDIEIRFIEYMPFDGNKWSEQKMLSYQEMLAIIRQTHPDVQKVQDHLNDTSKTFNIPGYQGRIGFITSMTDHFCGTCNRLRITSDGSLKVCLFGNTEVSLRDILRKNYNNGEPVDEAAVEAMKQVEMDRREGRFEGQLGTQADENELLNVIGAAVKRKKAQHAGMDVLKDMPNRPMITIGG